MQYKIFSLAVFVIFSLPCVIEDFKTLKINPWNAYYGTVILALASIIFYPEVLGDSLISCGGLLLVFLVTRLIVKEKLGLGDVKYSLFCGFACGNIILALAGLGISCVLTGITFLCLKICGKTAQIKKLPFVPFMFLGTVCVMFYGM